MVGVDGLLGLIVATTALRGFPRSLADLKPASTTLAWVALNVTIFLVSYTFTPGSDRVGWLLMGVAIVYVIRLVLRLWKPDQAGQ